jgi:3',5'-cyclic-nucleotide phosphodiesterase
METALFGGPPELGNMLKLGNGQIGFMNTFAYPLFDSVTDLLPRMGFTVQEISANRSIWSMKVDQQKKKQALIRTDTTFSEGWVSPRSQSPARRGHSQTDGADDEYFPPQAKTPSRWVPEQPPDSRRSSNASASHLVPGGTGTPKDQSRRSSLQSPFGLPLVSSTPEMISRRSSGAFPGANLAPPPLQARRSSNTVPSSQLQLNDGAGGALAQNGQYSSGAGGENESTPRSSNADRDVFAAVVLTNPGRSGVASAPDLMTEESNRRAPESRRFGHQSPFQNCSTGRISLPSSSSHTRDSQATSGTRALSSVMTPVSPSTQATSFLTVDSDDKSFQNMGVDSRPHSASMPVVFDPERGRIAAEKNGVRTSVLGNGAIGEPGRSVPRRRSRLKLAFWRKKPSSESTP